MAKLDKHTFESLWQLWTKTSYVEDNYPEVAMAYKKSGKDFAEFISKKYPGLVDEFVYQSPYLGKLDGCNRKKKSCKKGRLGDFIRIKDYTDAMAIKDVAKTLGIPPQEVRNVIQAYWDIIRKQIHNRQIIKIRNVGSISKVLHKYNDYLNDNGREKNSYKIKFVPSANLKK